MTKNEAIALANSLANEADEAGIPHAFFLRESANDTRVWSVLEEDHAAWRAVPVQLWVSPDLSFPLSAPLYPAASEPGRSSFGEQQTGD